MENNIIVKKSKSLKSHCLSYTFLCSCIKLHKKILYNKPIVENLSWT